MEQRLRPQSARPIHRRAYLPSGPGVAEPRLHGFLGLHGQVRDRRGRGMRDHLRAVGGGADAAAGGADAAVAGAADGTADVANTAAVNGETTATRLGRETHASWDYGPGFIKELKLRAGGRVDAINFDTRQVIELKPNNSRAIRLGSRQIEDYLAKLNQQFPGEPWTGSVVTYGP